MEWHPQFLLLGALVGFVLVTLVAVLSVAIVSHGNPYGL